MAQLLTFALTVFTGFFAIMNPIANIPIFSSLVEGSSKAERREISKRAVAVAFVIVTVFILLGKFIFELFGITIPAFKITGGILVFYVGFQMLESKKSDVKEIKNPAIDEDIAISPLAIPILAGPGTIVTAMNYVTNTNFLRIGIVVAVFALMCLLNYAAFILSDFVVARLGNNVIKVVGKIMGLIIAIIGTSMIIEGLKIAFSLS